MSGRRGVGKRCGGLLAGWLAVALLALPAPAVLPAQMALPALASAGAAGGPVIFTATPLVFGEVPGANAERGVAVACDGNRLVVGARFDGPHGEGAVYTFDWEGTDWAEEPPLYGAQPGEQFGISVALHGATLAVGAVGEERNQQHPAGQVRLFAFSEDEVPEVGGWTNTAPVVGEAGVRQRGRAVALADAWLAVAATVPGAGGEYGAVDVYPILSGSGIPSLGQVKHLDVADAEPGDRFGESLALAGGTLIAGAPGHRGAAGQPVAGTAYIFAPATGLPFAELHPADEGADSEFGSAVAVSGKTIVVGAPGASAAAGAGGAIEAGGSPGLIGRSGAVYVFILGAPGWTQQAKLVPAAAAAGDRFGQAVAIDGDRLVVGAPRHADGGGAAAKGAVFVFQRGINGIWSEVPGAATAGATRNALYGFAVAQSGGAVVVGAPLAAGRAGAAVAFRPDAVSTNSAAGRRSPASGPRLPGPAASGGSGAVPR